MYKVSIEPHWRIAYAKNAAMDTALLLRLLSAIQTQGAILQAAKLVNLSYRHAWGLLREAETVFGGALLNKHRGRGTTLTSLGTTLLWADRRIAARLSPTLESLSSELEAELAKSLVGSGNVMRLCASHGFAVAALMERISKAGLPVELRYLSGMEALAALQQKECELAGFHVPIGPFAKASLKRYANFICPASHSLINLATLDQGLFVAPGNPKNIASLADLARAGIRFVNRQSGSGTRRVLEMLLQQAGIPPNKISGFETAEFTHSAIAAYIASNMADAGFGVETAARQFGLDFVPLLKERYFFAASNEALGASPLKEVIAILQSEDFSQEVNQLQGYDATDTGRLMKVEDVFGKGA
jgi:molybdate transport repressor ModE-like protein